MFYAKEKCGGLPAIRGTRVLVLDILDWIKEGKSFREILENFPTIQKEDFQEIIEYAKEIIVGEVTIYGPNEHQISTG
ncbi:MAG: DUF433 domain-containing protein [Promethearchaeota archaeon]